ncbi:zinc finger protein 800 isoform X2 [Ascaphus truei]|uniref:zinc finger protein 800 isoform X2 n=1 Tax=Ascaphus truei TaxID=8439 RepID=UPI003F593835
MEKNCNTHRKTRFMRNKSNNDMDAEDTRLHTARMPVRDKCCQTDHYGCCEPVQLLEPGDPPLLQQQVQTSKSGIQQIIECFRSGTKQLKHMLLKEVDTIFECKSCRSLFRGLPNLVTHKQFYCFSKLRMDENPPNENDKQSKAIKDLLEAIYPRVDKPEYVIKLEPIQTNQNAVFQYVTPIDDTITIDSVDKSNADDPVEIQVETIPAQSKPVLTPEIEVVEPASTECDKKEVASSISAEVEQPQVSSPVAKLVKGSVNGHPFSCRVCKKDFNCRRSIRRHIKKVHKKKLEEIKKFIETRRKQSLCSAKGHNRVIYTTSSTSCHMCQKSFATKANVRRHIDEVHKGLRRDSITPETPTKHVKNVTLETASPKKPLKTVSPKKSIKTVSRTQKSSVKSDFSLRSCKCPHCKRRYSSQFLLKKHVQIVHKTTLSGMDAKRHKRPNTAASTDGKVKVENPNSANSSPSSAANLPQSELKGTNHSNGKKNTQAAQKSKVKPDADSTKLSSPSVAVKQKKYRKTKLSAGFDFKQLYCKLCKRQFTSKQNLTKHIELHTDGNNIFVKFYRCPLCNYETRRKRDVIRHITVVHKRSSRALVKITANLETRAIKKPIEFVLCKVTKRGPQKDKTKLVSSKQDDETSVSPSKKYDGSETGLEVKVTKNFSLHKYNKCGKAFAKKTDLDQHKKDHKANSTSSPVETKTKGRSTRSKTLVW